MILYFANRKMEILGMASTYLPEGFIVTSDKKVEDIETGVASLESTILANISDREVLESYALVGNFILRKNGDENEFYTIIESEYDTEKHEMWFYAEDAGLDLINEVVDGFEAPQAYPVKWYIDKFTVDSGFIIGINEVSDLSRKLKWDSESTTTERLASIAAQFDAEISYSFEVKGLSITKKLINIYKKRGHDTGVQLRLDKEVDRIITKKSITNLATALRVTGGTPENTEENDDPQPITLNGYKYDDGKDFHVRNGMVCSRKALAKWSRYLNPNEPNKTDDVGHIVKTFSYDTLSQSELCNRAIAELKKICDMEVNYEADITKFPETVKIGDRVNIIDNQGGLYLSTRILKLETSICNGEKIATLGENLLKGSGISQKVADLAAQFAKQTISAKRALEIAKKAKDAALKAKDAADNALKESQAAAGKAENAQQGADNALQSAKDAATKADAAEQAVQGVVESVESITETVEKAQAAADNAYKAAEQAEQKAEEAKQSLSKAEQDAEEAKEAAGNAQSSADIAVKKATEASAAAGTAKTQAESASATAAAAKADAKKAQEEINNLGDSLTTLSNTMKVDYARKTDLTESEARLQTQITQNAGEISSTASKVQKIDETANDAKAQADLAQSTAAQAQAQADAASGEATKAQTAADAAQKAADAAQANADSAKLAADTAQNVAAKAEEDLNAAKEDLKTVQGRVNATEEDIIAAQQKVTEAQAAADKAKKDAQAAVGQATEAQNTANTAKENAENAQTAANDAANKAAIAQKTAEEAKGEATAAQTAADEAAKAAAQAQNTAISANATAAEAQTKANAAAQTAADAQEKADAAASKAETAQSDLVEAKKNLADVSSKVDATEEEVAAAQAAVDKAQAAADKAKADAQAAQNTADTAKQNADNAQAAADTAKQAADKAQKDALKAKQAADKAQADADALAVRVTSAETKITQNSEAIKLAATKKEVTQTLGGYYTKKETDAAIKVQSDSITQTVKKQINEIEVGGRNLQRNTAFEKDLSYWKTSSLFALDATKMHENTNTVKYHKASATADAQSHLYSGNKAIPIEEGQEVTASAYFYTDDFSALDGRKPTLAIWFYSDTGATVKTFVHNIPFVDKKWIRYFCTATAPAKSHFVAIVITGYRNGTFYTAKPKLEKGNKATDWSPAPEDMASSDSVEDAQETADKAQASANTNKSRLEVSETTIKQLSDSISSLVTDSKGTSLMTQTSNGWTFNIGAIQDKLNDAGDRLNDLSGNVNGVEDTLNKLDSLIDDISKKTAYIIMATDESGNPCIELGKEGNPFKVRITNTSVDFMEGSNKIAYISNNSLYIEKAIIKNELQIGDGTGYIWKRRSNGNMGLRYVKG